MSTQSNPIESLTNCKCIVWTSVVERIEKRTKVKVVPQPFDTVGPSMCVYYAFVDEMTLSKLTDAMKYARNQCTDRARTSPESTQWQQRRHVGGLVLVCRVCPYVNFNLHSNMAKPLGRETMTQNQQCTYITFFVRCVEFLWRAVMFTVRVFFRISKDR